MGIVLKRLQNMAPIARWVLRGGLIVANGLIIGAMLLLWVAGDVTYDTYYLHTVAQSMQQTCLGVLFIVVFGSAFLEQAQSK